MAARLRRQVIFLVPPIAKYQSEKVTHHKREMKLNEKIGERGKVEKKEKTDKKGLNTK